MQTQTAQSHQVTENQRRRGIVGCLLGTAVGDALGLPCEALPRKRQEKLYPEIDGHHFIFGRGMISDDTEHACMTAQALIVSARETGRFSQSFAWRLRWWLMSFPPAIGLATLRALLKLWAGFPPGKRGVFSAGNGPAMRSAILGVCYGDDLSWLRKLVKVSARITHTDPKAEWAALAVAVPVALQTWLRQPSDFSGVLHAIRCGGDTDTVAAIVGRIIGARVGKEGIPQQWLERIWEWPRSTAWIEQVGERLAQVCATGIPQQAVPLPVWALSLRSIGFTAVVLGHGLRRLFPPF